MLVAQSVVYAPSGPNDGYEALAEYQAEQDQARAEQRARARGADRAPRVRRRLVRGLRAMRARDRAIAALTAGGFTAAETGRKLKVSARTGGPLGEERRNRSPLLGG